MARKSSVERFLSADKTYLQNENSNIRLICIAGKSISFGRKIYLRPKSEIVMIAFLGNNYIFSISEYDGKNIEEMYYRVAAELNSEFWDDVPNQYVGILDLNLRFLK